MNNKFLNIYLIKKNQSFIKTLYVVIIAIYKLNFLIRPLLNLTFNSK